MKRRSFLTALGTAAAASLAGCINQLNNTPDAELGDAITLDQYTLVAENYTRSPQLVPLNENNKTSNILPEPTHAITIHVLNTSNNPAPVTNLLNTLTITDGTQEYAPTNKPTPAHSQTLLPGELLTVRYEYPTTENPRKNKPYPNPVTLNAFNNPEIRLYHPDANDINDSPPEATLNYSVPPISDTPLTTENGTKITVDTTGTIVYPTTHNKTTTRDTYIPPQPLTTTITLKNTTDNTITPPPLIIKNPNGTEQKPTEQNPNLNNPLQPNETITFTTENTLTPFYTRPSHNYLAIRDTDKKHLIHI